MPLLTPKYSPSSTRAGPTTGMSLGASKFSTGFLGLDLTASGTLLGRDGAVSRRLFALGPVTRGTFWEMTAGPDIGRQAELLAPYLAALIRPMAPVPVARVALAAIG